MISGSTASARIRLVGQPVFSIQGLRSPKATGPFPNPRFFFITRVQQNQGLHPAVFPRFFGIRGDSLKQIQGNQIPVADQIQLSPDVGFPSA